MNFFSFCRFCGFESDVVIIKRQFHNINLSGRFVNENSFQVNADAYIYNLCEHYLLAKFMFYQTQIGS